VGSPIHWLVNSNERRVYCYVGVIYSAKQTEKYPHGIIANIGIIAIAPALYRHSLL
jgi:hypothetical protein